MANDHHLPHKPGPGGSPFIMQDVGTERILCSLLSLICIFAAGKSEMSVLLSKMSGSKGKCQIRSAKSPLRGSQRVITKYLSGDRMLSQN